MKGWDNITGKLRIVGRFALELVIVFLGVYLAFLFADHRDAKKDLSLGVKYHELLITEFQTFAELLQWEKKKIEKYLNVVAEIEQGGQPDLLASDLYYFYRGSVLDAAFDSRNFESLDASTLKKIVTGLPALEILEKQINRFNQLSATVLLPAKASGTSYYDSEGQLRPEFAWYSDLIRGIAQINEQLHKVIKEVAIPDLEQSKEKIEL